MAIKELTKFYFKNAFLWWGILLGLTGIGRANENIEQFREFLWFDQGFFWIFWIIFGIACIQSYLPLFKEKKNTPKFSKDHELLLLKSIGISAILFSEAIAFVIAIVNLMGVQTGTIPQFQAYHTWLGIVFVLNYIFMPFCLGWMLHGKRIALWVQTSPHRKSIIN